MQGASSRSGGNHREGGREGMEEAAGGVGQ